MCQHKRIITSPWGETFEADECMIPVLRWLWKGGFRTSEHCCGHGSFSSVCFPSMYKQMKEKKQC